MTKSITEVIADLAPERQQKIADRVEAVASDVTPRHRPSNRITICPACGHPLAHEFAELFPLVKRRIYDAMVAAGAGGLTTERLMQIVYHGIREQDQASSEKVMHVHISQMNKLLRAKGLVIRSHHHVYRLWPIGAA